MGAIWLTGLADCLRNAGLHVVEYDGWKTRARNSGGFDAMPLCVMWHHTASNPSTNGKPDADYIVRGSENSPISNLYLDRSGTVWVIAAGATNTNGKGKSITFSRGTVPADGMNTRALGVEMANNGIGERWPKAQIDAMFILSNACNAMFGNRPDDLSTHQYYANPRKIDPATDNVEGNWIPTTCNSSKSWDRSSVQNEAMRRANSIPAPIPEPIEPDSSEDDMPFIIINNATGQPALVYGNGKVTGLDGNDLAAFCARFGEPIPTADVIFLDFASKGV